MRGKKRILLGRESSGDRKTAFSIVGSRISVSSLGVTKVSMKSWKAG